MATVDVTFRVYGHHLDVDHGYHLLSAVSKLIPEIHGDETTGVHPISGTLVGNRSLLLTDKSCLTFRLPAERIKQILPLAGKALQIGDHTIRIGVPYTRALVPKPRLYSRLVVIKGFMEPEPFLEAAQRQLDSMGIQGRPHLIDQPTIQETNKDREGGTHSPVLRRTIKIREREIVGFALKVEQLTAEESILLQEKGLGGRRRFGCGIFIPDRR